MIPESERVCFEVNLLEHVSCNLRFPPILNIASSSPVAFQERIRGRFPYYKPTIELKLNASMQPGSPFPTFTSHNLPIPGTPTHLFESEDLVWNIKLANDNILISCKKYDNWSTFQEWARFVIEALWDVYKLNFVQHVCLRYKNAVRKGVLGVDELPPWSNLIKPWAGGALVIDGLTGVVEMSHRFVIELPNRQGRLEASCSLGSHQPSKEAAFLIESHVYNEENKRLPDVFRHLHSLNLWAGRFFRWCITDELRALLRPVLPNVESPGNIPIG